MQNCIILKVQFLGGKKMKTRAKINERIEPKITITIRIPLKEKIALVKEAKKKKYHGYRID